MDISTKPDLKPKSERRKPYQWSIRNTVQAVVLAITVIIGIQFYFYVEQLKGGGDMTIPRPPGVEAFLPIGSLMAWKHFFQTGIWDHVHPAGMVILGFAIVISWVFRKAFCSWFCPVGTVSEYLWQLGRKLFGRSFRIPRLLDIPLRSLKYLIMAFFVYAVLIMDIPALQRWLNLPYWQVSDIKMLNFFTGMSSFAVGVVVFLAVASLLVRNFWCRYLCPYGALVGIAALVSPSTIKRNVSTCIDCNLCEQVCPAYLPVDSKPEILSAECTGCISCVEVCPVNNTLDLKMFGAPADYWSPSRLAIGIAGLFIVVVFTARLTGHWASSVSVEDIRAILPSIDSLLHF